MSNQVVQVTVPEGTRMRVGVPAEQPEEAVAALKTYFSGKQNIVSARLGLMEILFADGTSQFSYTVGIQCNADQDLAEQEALKILQPVPAGRWPISIVPLTNQFFTEEAIVFYEKEEEPAAGKRGKRSWLFRLIGK